MPTPDPGFASDRGQRTWVSVLASFAESGVSGKERRLRLSSAKPRQVASVVTASHRCSAARAGGNGVDDRPEQCRAVGWGEGQAGGTHVTPAAVDGFAGLGPQVGVTGLLSGRLGEVGGQADPFERRAKVARASHLAHDSVEIVALRAVLELTAYTREGRSSTRRWSGGSTCAEKDNLMLCLYEFSFSRPF